MGTNDNVINSNQEIQPKKKFGCLSALLSIIIIITALMLVSSFYKNHFNDKYEYIANGKKVYSITHPKKFHHKYGGTTGAIQITKSCSISEVLKYSLDCDYNIALSTEIFKNGETGYYNNINEYGKANYVQSTIGGKPAYLFNTNEIYQNEPSYALIFTKDYLIRVNGIKPYYAMISQAEVDKLLSKLTIY